MTKIEYKNIIDKKKVMDFAKLCKVTPFFARLLLLRNIDSKDRVEKYLYGTLDDLTDPFLYTNMKVGVEKILDAIDKKKKILIYGDYDCDGIGATAILFLAFLKKNVFVDYYIPTRKEEGYGLNCDTIRNIHKDFSPELIITVDCGITSISEVELIKELGMDILITDHHKIGEKLPDCTIINPCLDTHLTQLCGAGVAYTLVRAMFGREYANEFLDICAISTIADLVNLVGDNRLIVKYGLKKIQSANCRKGIKKLLYSCSVKCSEVTVFDIAFKIAPRLNASGRLDSAYNSLHLLIEDDDAAINIIAELLNNQNIERQGLNNAILCEALELLKHYDFGKYKIVILHKSNWNEGVIGIVAAKITEMFNLPTILFSGENDVIKGSARSISSINIYDAIDAGREYIERFGGHPMAAGVSIRKSNFDDFCNAVNNFVLENSSQETLQKRYKVDDFYGIKSITKSIISDIELMEPFGMGNPKPVFCDNVNNYDFKAMKKGSKHFKARASLGDIIIFNSNFDSSVLNYNLVDLVYSIDKNYYNYSVYNQFKVQKTIIDSSSLNNDLLLDRYLYMLSSKNVTEEKCIEKSPRNNTPILYVAYSQSKYQEFLFNNPDINTFIFATDYFFPYDTLVLSPSVNFPFEYYNKIVFLEEVSDYFVGFIKKINYNCEFIKQYYPLSSDLTLSKLRKLFVKFSGFIQSGYAFVSTSKMYQDFYGYFSDITLQDFLIAYYTFIEVGLLKISSDDILHIINMKTDITKSKIYQGYITTNG